MSTQSGTAGSAADSGVPSGCIGWTSPANAEGATDGVYATANLANSGGMPNINESTTLQASGFGLSVPSTATINGIQVNIYKYASPTYSPSIRDLAVGIGGSGTLESCTANRAQTGTDWASSSDSNSSYGGPTDLWGASTIAAADVNSGLAVALQCQNTNTSFYIQANVDSFSVTVTYTPAGGGATLSATVVVPVRRPLFTMRPALLRALLTTPVTARPRIVVVPAVSPVWD